MAQHRWSRHLVGGLAAALAVAALPSGPAAADPVAGSGAARPARTVAPLLPAGADALPDRYLVVLAKSQLVASGTAAGAPAVARARARGVRVDQEYRHALAGYAARLDAAQLAAVRADPDVAYVEPDRLVQPTDRQLTPRGAWGLDRIDQRTQPTDGWYYYFPTGAGVRAYVVDSGIRASHLDFGGRVSVGADLVGDGRDGDDCTGHGTHVAGILGGRTYGVAKQVQLVTVRVVGCSLSPVSTAIAGLDWVAGNAVRPAVANFSLTVPGGNAALDAAVAGVIAQDIAVFTGAGNDRTDACTYSPARLPEAVTVGASVVVDGRDGRWNFSNFGACLDLFAPGELIESDGIRSDFDTRVMTGTSQAAPHVAGTAALFLQTHPTAGAGSVRHAIVSTATAGVLAPPGPLSPNLLLFTPGAADRAFGHLDAVDRAPGGLRVAGWAADPDTTAPIDVHIYLDGGFVTALRADGHRPDVGAAFPAFGPDHGFDLVVPVGNGDHEVCVYAIDVEIGPDNPQLGCVFFSAVSDLPVGALELARRLPGGAGLRVLGWALDWDTTAPIEVHVYVDGVFAGALLADQPRPDIAAGFPGYGEQHGFNGRVPAPAGGLFPIVCVYAINVGPGGSNPELGCQAAH